MVRKIQSRIKVKENLISWIHHQEYIYWSITTYDHACHSPRLRQKNNIEGIIKRKRNFMEKETLSPSHNWGPYMHPEAMKEFLS
jgi:hypothetical protein